MLLRKLILCSLVLLVATSSCTDATNSPGAETLKIGGLLSLTGGWSTLGKAGQEAFLLAVQDAEQDLADAGKELVIETSIGDTKLDTSLTIALLQDLSANGYNVVIGPQGSGEVRAIKSLADQKDILIISPGSTAGSLSIAGDNVIRFAPDD